MSEDYPPSFEDTLAELEAMVDTLDQGDLPLDGVIKRFDRSATITRVSGEIQAQDLNQASTDPDG